MKITYKEATNFHCPKCGKVMEYQMPLFDSLDTTLQIFQCSCGLNWNVWHLVVTGLKKAWKDKQKEKTNKMLDHSAKNLKKGKAGKPIKLPKI